MTGVRFDIAAGVTATVTWVNGKYRVTAGGKSRSFTAPVTFTPDSGSLNLLTATDLGDTGRFRGVIRVLRPDGGFMIVNKLPLESYLRGVVPREVSPSWPAESLKAQAVAARSYAQRSRNPNDAYDVYCTTRDQVYMGGGAEDPRTNAAIRDTAGVVPTYDGSVITAFYFSTSGGHTENIENSWQTSAVPYLKGVSDPYDTYSPRHNWTPAQYAASSLAKKLGASVSGSLRAIYVVDRGVSPRIVKAAIVGSDGVQFLHGSIVRSKLGLMDSWAYFRSMSISPAARRQEHDHRRQRHRDQGAHLPGHAGRRVGDAALLRERRLAQPERRHGAGEREPGQRLHGQVLDVHRHAQAGAHHEVLLQLRQGPLAADHHHREAGAAADAVAHSEPVADGHAGARPERLGGAGALNAVARPLAARTPPP